MIVFDRSTYDAMIDTAIDGSPEEVCGVLAGSLDSSRSTVGCVHAARNAAGNPCSAYYMDPEEQYEIVSTIESNGNDVVGFYHSHPHGPPQPSVIDRDRATWPGVSYVVIALDGHPFMGSWRWQPDEFVQEIVGLE